MLNSEEIESGLMELGLTCVVNNAHAHGYALPGGEVSIYVKVRSLREGARAMHRYPLVIHPDVAARLSSATGVRPSGTTYFNANLRGFPKRVNTGKTPTAWGCAYEVDDFESLRAAVQAVLPELMDEQLDERLAAALASAKQELADDPDFLRAPAQDREVMALARIGQGKYRNDMLVIWNQRCAVTGCSIQKALIASHAKAWRDSTGQERIDPYNGLPLTASIDRLFDQGLISFRDTGEIIFKREPSPADLNALGLRSSAKLRQVPTRLLPYLRAHRTKHNF